MVIVEEDSLALKNIIIIEEKFLSLFAKIIRLKKSLCSF
ncbi:hypothetical protein HMPREF9176_0155 [Streptococcus downei F0415]|nr:hypothetical protein HMPREF9176_0155 [Streptococcus downei F0415]